MHGNVVRENDGGIAWGGDGREQRYEYNEGVKHSENTEAGVMSGEGGTEQGHWVANVREAMIAPNSATPIYIRATHHQ